jgi:hypothetical protein
MCRRSRFSGRRTASARGTNTASAQEILDYADQCLEWAARAESDQERKMPRRMALTLWRIARLTEEGRSLGPPFIRISVSEFNQVSIDMIA